MKNTINAAKHSAQMNLATLNNDLMADTDQELIEKLKAENAQLKKELDESKLNAKIDTILVKAGAKNPIAVRALLDISKLERDSNGEIHELDALIAEIKSQEAYLFHPAQRNGIFGHSPEENFHEAEFDPFIRGFRNR